MKREDFLFLFFCTFRFYRAQNKTYWQRTNFSFFFFNVKNAFSILTRCKERQSKRLIQKSFHLGIFAHEALMR